MEVTGSKSALKLFKMKAMAKSVFSSFKIYFISEEED